MKKFRVKGEVETFPLDQIAGDDFEGWSVGIQHLGASEFRAYGFAFQRVSVKYGVDVANLNDGAKTETELDALQAHLAVLDQICKDTVVRLECEGEVLEGEAAASRILDWGLGTPVGMKALDCQRLRPHEVLS